MNRKKVLIIDDDSRNIFALTATLKSRSFECISCLSAPEAIELLQKQKDIDIILIDMMMPEMDGYDAIPLIKELPDYKQVPVIAVTAQAMTGDREKCIEAGADDYISKPINVDKLMLVLNQL
ncbi:response regulator [Flavobacterium antarcticum]|uniref:response regulator n=1 Tax=Flavobacterium antarcticum TaxID=271155 RepID=UPI0003B66B3E|nr:response regulator [Flavobacterium antarcticum]